MIKSDFGIKALKLHKKLKGKIEISLKAPIVSLEDLKIFYTPGVGAVASHLAKHPEDLSEMTIKNNTILIVSDGSAVLGLGNIGPGGALPVMEGKAMIFKQFAGINAFPLVLATQDADEIVKTIQYLSPAFGGINLEDISAPRCFDIEERLIDSLDIPVMHDDQHGTAIVVLAGLINAFKASRRELQKSKIVILGAGAAGAAIAKMLKKAGIKEIIVIDRKGIIAPGRGDLNFSKKELAEITNPKNIKGEFKDAIQDADAVIGVSGPGLIKYEHIKLMAKNPIVFALANPTPEIMPQEARRGGAFIIATGRSDFPNQINNALAFPGVFRGALDNKVKKITDQIKMKAAYAIASMIKKPTPRNIVPSIFNKKLVKTVAKVIK
ncbi:MAG: NADP-dependent malic enzyme [Patescibacteria group bacterium]